MTRYTGPVLVAEGWPFLLGSLVLAAGAAVAGWCLLVLLFGALFLFLVAFFRNPRRTPPSARHLVVSPADGRVLFARPTADGGAEVAIFMSVVSVHVNRAPLGGKVLSVEHRPGAFLNADHAEAGIRNEQRIYTLQTPAGVVILKQIAGVLARRTVSWVAAGDTLGTGDPVGMIKFSSRAEVLLPPGVGLSVGAGDAVYAGETVIGSYEALEEKAAEAAGA